MSRLIDIDIGIVLEFELSRLNQNAWIRSKIIGSKTKRKSLLPKFVKQKMFDLGSKIESEAEQRSSIQKIWKQKSLFWVKANLKAKRLVFERKKTGTKKSSDTER
jgi:hypothetical protein